MVTSTASGPRAGRSTGLGIRLGTPAALLALAAVGWWWSTRMAGHLTGDVTSPTGMGGGTATDMAGDEAMSFVAFLVAWLAMMAAMMFPAITPVVKLYGRAAAAGRVAPLPFFVAGYIVVWGSVGVPAYVAWRWLMDPIAEGRSLAARLAGVALLAAAAWQLTPLKRACLRHCRSPISFFLRFGAKVARPGGALRMGATHGVFCLGCCWALMAVLVAVGTMHLAWMIALALLILVEKDTPIGERVARLASVALLSVGVGLLVRPEILTALT
ncbi:MAG: DUF2182 domain-containing protein [Actinomycetota bacterium]|nr:DUF2182 domain-containing protein [Actinomycetota bacterium]